jgi:DNA-binding NarL/FixJ family response regulator
LRGDLSGAVEAFEESNTGGATASRRLFDTDRLLSSCWLLAAQGQLTAASKKAEAIGTAAAERGLNAFATLALHEAVRLGSRTAIDPLVKVAARCETRLAAAMSAHASARGGQDPALLLEAVTKFLELGCEVFAAEAAITAAEMFRNEGRQASARSADAMADAILEGCEGIRTPIVDGRTVASAKLTARESEIARRAALGLSNRDIAEELFTSVRTVEGHLLRAFNKLGISKRSELRAVLGESRPQR